MTMYPDIIPSLGDITKLGVEYSLTTPDALDHVIATFPLPTGGDLASLYARVLMGDTLGNSFAQFELKGVFQNTSGVITTKFDVNSVNNPANSNNKFFFRITGLNVEVVCNSGLASPCDWLAVIANIGFLN